MSEQQIREEEVKNKLSQDYFQDFDCTKILGNVDFCVTLKSKNKSQLELTETESLLWAEAKKGKANFYTSLVQLILTIGKARTFDIYLPPAYLGAFDTEKIAFIPYNEIQDIFYINDFNWNVAPSNHETKEFKQVYEKVIATIENHSLVFFFGKDDEDVEEFIETNFVLGKSATSKVRIDKNNFIVIYNKWLTAVKPTISVNWEIAKKAGIIDGDFYLADLLSRENETLIEKLYVLLQKDHYKLDRKLDEMGMFNTKTVSFINEQKAHIQFWNKYERPPQQQYWDYIVERRDLLVPQDIRERKGSFYTPQIWVELSQKYLTDVLGEDWQDEYYIWDCAAGTGNLLTGLTNKYHIFASTLDKQDVDVIHSRIDSMNANSITGQGSNLLHNHVFQFDFLNDSFDKLPKPLLEIINDAEKRKKLLIYINPPYAEASSYGKNSIPQVANETRIFNSFKSSVGSEAMSELFAQFFIRVNKEIPDSFLAAFSTPKYITSEKFDKFRKCFNAEYQKGFICRSDTFDNVKGKFPISFLIWNFKNDKEIKYIKTDVFLNNKEVNSYSKKGTKKFYTIKSNSIADWRKTFYFFGGNSIGNMIIVGTSMQSNNNTFITNYPAESYKNKGMVADITKDNLIEMVVYLSVRQIIDITWINNKDQFLHPNKKWEKDKEFQNDCLTFALFHGQNKISAEEGKNHWLPFKEQEINSREKFESNFMTDFMAGKIKKQNGIHLFEGKEVIETVPLVFSEESKAVFDAGRELWKYYHSQPYINVNASLYDIRAHFQGRDKRGRMKNKSKDNQYMKLISQLRENLKTLAQKIEPKIYQYGFLKK